MSKSRSGKTPNSNQNAVPGPTQNAIIPGKFMESDWYELLEVEEDENFIADIIDEITKRALDEVANNIVKSRVLPHTVLAVRELLLDVIQWQFLESDPGETGTTEKLSWIEDEEPCMSVIDNWAQGAVPVDTTTYPPVTSLPENVMLKDNFAVGVEEKNLEEVHSVVSGVSSVQNTADALSSTEASFAQLCVDDNGIEAEENESNEGAGKVFGDNAEAGESDILDMNVEIKRLSLSDRSCANSATVLPSVSSCKSSQGKKKSSKYRPHVGQLPVFEKIPLESVTDLRPKPGTTTESEQDMNSGIGDEFVVRNQYGRASGPKEVIYDERGKVVKVEKLNVHHFPTHRVPVKYSVVDDSLPDLSLRGRYTTSSSTNSPSWKKTKKQQPVSMSDRYSNRINAKALLQRMNHSKIPNNTSLSSLSSLGITNNNAMHLFKPLEPRSPLPPLMVDSINVSDGVTIREGGLSKQMVRKMQLEPASDESNREIFPISDTPGSLLNVQDIVDKTSYRYIAAS